MGTSGSSSGPGSGVPMVPPWADPAPDGGGDGDNGVAPANGTNDGDGPNNSDGTNEDSGANTQTPAPRPQPLLAPAGRFRGARTNIGSFGKSGSSDDMRRGVGQYVKKGYGGSSTATQRMGGTARVASGLSSALSGGGGGPGGAGQSTFAQEMQGKSADEVISGIVDAVAPTDGTQDLEASRESIREVLGELVQENPDVDLLALDMASTEKVVEGFVAADVYRRIFLDIGKKIQDAAPSAKAGLQRLRQVKEYVRETVKSSFKSIRDKFGSASQSNVTKIARDALKETFTVFEGYAE